MEGSIDNTYTDSLHIKMKRLITEINKYLTVKTEDSVFLINKNLQTFSVTIDINIFDPDTNLGVEFFICLYNLFVKTEPQSQMSWYCVDVLCNACRNTSARQALIDTYNFIPSLSQLLGDQLTDVKKKKLLKLMQDLSCGIKISWQIPHLPHLLKTLTKWVESQDQEIVCLSLGVLVNLCYKNLPAVYTLSKTIDIKKFLRFCLPLKGPITEIYVCKLMVVLDYMHVDIPKNTLVKLVEPTFLSIFESFKSNDAIVLRQIVDFFLDAIRPSKGKLVLRECSQYENHIENLLQLVDNSAGNSSKDSGYSVKDSNPECVCVILEFIHSIMCFDAESVTSLNPNIIKLAINWINSEFVSFQALAVLTKIVEKVLETENDRQNSEIFESLVAALPVFLLILQSNAIPSNMESCRRLGALLQLLRGMVQAASTRPGVLQMLKEELIAKVFVPLHSENLNVECLPILKSNDVGVSSTDAVGTYLYALGLVNDLAQCGTNWLGLQSSLMENRKVHMIIAQALYGGTTEIRSMALEISRHPNFPVKKVASTLGILRPEFSESNGRVQRYTEVGFPILSFTQMERLDDALDKLEKLMGDGNTASIVTSQVMELYEYKLATLGYAEKSALASIEAATERCTQLQHRLAQITAEQNKLQQLLFHEQYCLEQTMKSNKEFRELYTMEQNRAQAALGKIKVYEEEMRNKEKLVKELESLVKKVEHMSDVNSKLTEQLAKKEQVINKLAESGNKSEKNLQKAEDLLKKANLENKKLNSNITELEEKLDVKEMRLAELTEQYHQMKHIIDTITKVATSSQVP
ncbi:uncharacterized protein LOC108907489 [Anoplophora glabripennis]|uniref:uncharacterized protein LOC108907489 n=1 Tax=Anoplophora glabripennis TaxID=217634 RepID=UPI00087351CC|nr:uncharacterized protein LOC108907489 [Anoplophora glabripennis]XP_018566722.1 uncharacterized protein LOC108907489 [Anoplophora glabripennis]XP_018566723.1 uncharacterized protein LOC108907489 [Anoplophora glabripennis]